MSGHRAQVLWSMHLKSQPLVGKAEMKPHYNLVGIAAALLMTTAAPARASLINFEFSFIAPLGTHFIGKVTGEIDGLTDNATSAASAVIIDSISGIESPFALPYDTIADMLLNDFTVSNGEITAYNYVASIPDIYSLNLVSSEPTFQNRVSPGQIAGTEISFTPLFTATPGPAPAPEPSAIALFGTALAGLFLMSWGNRRRRQIRPDRSVLTYS